MIPSALGPAGIDERVQEIKAKMASFFGTSEDSQSFQAAMSNAAGKQISGQLSGSIGGGYSPMGIDGLGLSPDGAQPLRDMATQAAKKHGVDPNLYLALINQESSFNPTARSDKGALGLAQLMPGTAADLGVTDRLNPAQSLDAGAKYLAKM